MKSYQSVILASVWSLKVAERVGGRRKCEIYAYTRTLEFDLFDTQRG